MLNNWFRVHSRGKYKMGIEHWEHWEHANIISQIDFFVDGIVCCLDMSNALFSILWHSVIKTHTGISVKWNFLYVSLICHPLGPNYIQSPNKSWCERNTKFQEVETVWEGKRICNQIAPYRFLPMYWFNNFTQSFWYLSECWCVLRNIHCYVTKAKIEYPNRMIAFWNWNSFLQRVLIVFP